jgi:hypothetical protein
MLGADFRLDNGKAGDVATWPGETGSHTRQHAPIRVLPTDAVARSGLPLVSAMVVAVVSGTRAPGRNVGRNALFCEGYGASADARGRKRTAENGALVPRGGIEPPTLRFSVTYSLTF